MGQPSPRLCRFCARSGRNLIPVDGGFAHQKCFDEQSPDGSTVGRLTQGMRDAILVLDTFGIWSSFGALKSRNIRLSTLVALHARGLVEEDRRRHRLYERRWRLTAKGKTWTAILKAKHQKEISDAA